MSDPIRPVPAPLLGRLLGIIFAAALLAFPATAQDQNQGTSETPAGEASAPAVSPDTVVATVGGETITEADIAFAAEDLQQELAQMPPADRKAFLVTVLIDMKVMAGAAREAQMDQSEIFKRRLRYLEERALRRAFFADRIAAKVTEEAVQAAYDTLVAEFVPEDEVRASHILVQTEEDAKAIKAELDAGRPFDVLAKEKSIDPSAAQNAGDLGFFSRGMMVQPFEEAAFALTEPGQISEPVQSQFGWHVIRLEEKRKSQPPAIDALRPQLQQQILFEAFEDSVGVLKEGIAIEIIDPEVAAGVERQSQQQP